MVKDLEFVDTHCHLHFDDYQQDVEQVIKAASSHRVNKMVCVGVNLEDSQRAVKLANRYDNLWAAIGVHPHEGAELIKDLEGMKKLNLLSKKPKVVAIGEIGLDYYREHAPRQIQKEALHAQIKMGLPTGLPFIFHVRDALPAGRQAWGDFWQIIDSYPKIRGVVHCFSAHKQQLRDILLRGFYVGLNGIMTFTKDQDQLAAAKTVPLERLLLETDAPFLAPKPYRGQRCEPKHLAITAEFLANLRNESLQELAKATTKNAGELFGL